MTKGAKTAVTVGGIILILLIIGYIIYTARGPIEPAAGSKKRNGKKKKEEASGAPAPSGGGNRLYFMTLANKTIEIDQAEYEKRLKQNQYTNPPTPLTIVEV